MNTIVTKTTTNKLIDRVERLLAEPHLNDPMLYEAEIKASCVRNHIALHDLPNTPQDWACNLAQERANLFRYVAILRAQAHDLAAASA